MILMKLKQKFNCTRKNLCSTKNVTHLSGGRKEVRDILCFQKWSGNIFVFLLLVLSPSELSAHLVCFLQREDCAWQEKTWINNYFWKINWTNRFKYNLLMLKINVWQFIFIKVWSENNVLLYYSGSYSKSIHYFLTKLNLTLELTLPLFIVNRR